MISKEKLLEDTMKVKKPSKKMIAALAVVIAGISIASYFGVTNAAGSDTPGPSSANIP